MGKAAPLEKRNTNGRVRFVCTEGAPVPHADPEFEYDSDTDLVMWGADPTTNQPVLVMTLPWRIDLGEEYENANGARVFVVDAREVFMGYVENWEWEDGEEGRAAAEKLFREMAERLAIEAAGEAK